MKAQWRRIEAEHAGDSAAFIRHCYEESAQLIENIKNLPGEFNISPQKTRPYFMYINFAQLVIRRFLNILPIVHSISMDTLNCQVNHYNM